MTCPVLTMIGVAKHYRAGVTGCSATVDVLRAVDMQVHAGEILSLVGPPGAGKSTLLLCAAGLLHPDAGTVLWFGCATRRAERTRVIAFVAESRADYRSPTVREALAGYAPRPGLLLLDDPFVATDRSGHAALRSTLDALVSEGAAIIIASRPGSPIVDLATRHATLVSGVIAQTDQRRNRSAARMSASSWAPRASTSTRSTSGRSFRSPQ